MAGPTSDAVKALDKASAAAGDAELPDEGEFYYYKNFKGFKTQVDGFRGRLQTLLTSLPGAPAAGPEVFEDVGDTCDWVSTLLDGTLEQVDDAVAAARQALQQGPAAALPAGGGLAGASGVGAQGPATAAAQPAQGRRGSVGGTGAGGSGDGFVSYMNSQLQQRPQEAFDDPVDNSRAPFQHKLDSLSGVVNVEAAAAAAAAAAVSGAPRPHPLHHRLEGLQYPAWQLARQEAQPPKGYEETPFTYIDTVPALRAAAERLVAAKEIAIDLEAHSYRSFQGFCCLMQLSTRSEDIVIDTLALRSHIGPALAGVFADPGALKVLHGSDSDVVWLQRDFGLFLVNMFDTGQAARVLEFKGHGLAYLLDFYCAFKADKRFQLADWRARPLTEEMLHYARSDTHYLLYCYDRLKAALAEMGDAVPEHLQVDLPPGAVIGEGSGALATVLERSRRLCLVQYEKEQYSSTAFMDLFNKLNITLTDEQLSVFAALYDWRDSTARQLDESTGYLLPRVQLLKVAQALPKTVLDLHKAVGRSSPVVSRQAVEVLAAIQAARQPGSVAVVTQLRQQPWKQALAEHQQEAAAAAGQQQEQQEKQPAEPAVPAVLAAAAVAAPAAARPSLQPKAVKPLLAATGGGSLLGAAVAAPKPALLARAVKPLGGGSSMFAAVAAAAPAALPATAAPAAAAEAAAVEAATEEAAAAKPALQARQLKPLALQQRPAGASGLLGGGAVVAAAAVTATQPSQQRGQQPSQQQAPLLGRSAPSAAGSLLGAGASGSVTTAVAAAVKASFALPFSFAAATVAAPEPAAAAAAADEQQQMQQQDEEQLAAGAGGGVGEEAASQRDAIRSAVDAMRREGQQQAAQPPAAGGKQGSGGGGSNPQFMPLPVSERYGKGAIKRRQPQEQQPGGSGGGKKQRRAAAEQQKEQAQHLKRTMVELGLEDDSDADEGGSGPDEAPAGNNGLPQEQQQQQGSRSKPGKQQRQQQQEAAAGPRAPKASPAVDYSAAKRKFDLGIINPHAVREQLYQKQQQQGGRGRGGGRGGAAAGRGREGAGRGSGSRGGRGGSDGGSRVPEGKFNPYAAPEVNAMKAGKRSSVHVRSGNRSMTFRGGE